MKHDITWLAVHTCSAGHALRCAEKDAHLDHDETGLTIGRVVARFYIVCIRVVLDDPASFFTDPASFLTLASF